MKMNIKKDFLWTEKYRPSKVEDTILPAELKQTFQEFVNQRNVPNLILAGGPGCGKTTIARAMLEELGADYMVINGSMNGNIDTLRNDINGFASSISFTGGRKYVILDEADYLNANSTQPALRNFMEEFSKNCGFILTCNYKHKIIEPLHSRCSVIDFKITKKDRTQLAQQFLKRICGILTTEGKEFDKAVVAEVILKHFPDWRRVMNELQRYSTTGKIDSGMLATIQEDSYATLVQYLKDKEFTAARKWVAENLDGDADVVYRKLYDSASTYVKPNSVPPLVLLVAKYQYQAAFSADPEVNLMACLTEIMIECEFV
jgi:DNA polymerase III delta prime subunit